MSDQQFVLRWHHHESTIVRNLPYFIDNDVLCDVTLSVNGNRQLKAHKIVLAMCSVYFLQLFQELKSTHPVIILHNVSFDQAKAILSFVYRGQCVISQNELPNLVSVAKLLKIQGLCDMKIPRFDDISTEKKSIKTNDCKDSETCKCFLCGKYLSNQYNLRVHMETHEEAYHACESCAHVSRSRDALRKHVSYRHPELYQNKKRKRTDT